MSDIRLSFAMTPYDRIVPLINGEVKPDGITLDYIGMPGAVPRVFYEQIKFRRYDVSEMSLSSFLRMRYIGWPYLMLPVFHNRNFSYTYIYTPQLGDQTGSSGGSQGQTLWHSRLSADYGPLDPWNPADGVRRQAGGRGLVPGTRRAL